MKNIATKFAAGAASLAIVGSLLAPAAFAKGCVVAGNGKSSDNTCTVKTKTVNVTKQTNVSLIGNFVSVDSNTGGNTVKDNTGKGANTINPGDSNVSITITNNTGHNSIN